MPLCALDPSGKSGVVPAMDMDHVLRDLLAWDILGSLDSERIGSRQSIDEASSAAAPTAPPAVNLVRERFDSVGQYRHTWLRLALRETKAVVINKVETEGVDGPASAVELIEVPGQSPIDPLLRLRVSLAPFHNVPQYSPEQ